ncbi:MAG: hypothetical protein IIA17_02065 [candidate division Zixibacteria bacterium]|nr:hypothetical protein [candidate division Zixibacteria bacterium]
MGKFLFFIKVWRFQGKTERIVFTEVEDVTSERRESHGRGEPELFLFWELLMNRMIKFETSFGNVKIKFGKVACVEVYDCEDPIPGMRHGKYGGKIINDDVIEEMSKEQEF